ncbi:MAG: hypothetical protein ACW98Y_17590, partial [Candidatus Thorarchaeota archaeon]
MSDAEESNQEQSFISLGKLLAMVFIAVVVYLIMIFIGDWNEVVSYLAGLEWWVLPVMVGL